MYLNYTLTQEPILTKDFISLPFDGNIIISGQNHQDCMQIDMPIVHLPVFNEAGKNFQVYLSENVIKSAMKALHCNNELETDVDMPPAPIKALFPTFLNVHGSEYDFIPIHLKSIGDTPEVSLRKSGSQLKGELMLKIMNPLNPRIKSAIMNLTYDVNLKLSMDKQFKISGSLEDITMDVTSSRAYFKSEEDVESLTKKMKGV